MAICIIKTNKQLGIDFVLTPERYNPKRRMSITDEKTVKLSEIIEISNDTITVKQGKDINIIQINTSDAMGGYLNTSTIPCKSINSNKKRLKKGDVIISRLRPYLKQIAYVDHEMKNAILGASTEFFVLRSRTDESIAYLVPFLLSDAAQFVFANSVEGSQHPRFKEDDILNLELPISIYNNRKEISRNIIEAIKSYRVYESSISEEIFLMNKAI